MDRQKVVKNIQRICKEKGTTPTVAGRESGAGASLVTNLKRQGTLPSVEKIQLLAEYLGVTTSELLGEEKPTPVAGDSFTPKELLLIDHYRSRPEIQKAVDILLGLE